MGICPKKLGDEVRLSQTDFNKIGAWLKDSPIFTNVVGREAVGLVVAAVTGFCLGIILSPLLVAVQGNTSAKILVAGGAVASIVGYVSSVLFATHLGAWLEERPAVCLQALQSFMQRWSEHREKVPHVLQGIFDGLSSKYENGKLDISEQQALNIVEGVLALSVAAQIS
jgi:hypothetical protein